MNYIVISNATIDGGNSSGIRFKQNANGVG